MGFEFADKERVTVLDLMAQATATTPGLAPPGPPPGPMSQEEPGASEAPLDPTRTGTRQGGGKPEDLEGRIEWLTAELEALPDARTRGLVEELVSAVLELHGEGLGRVLELVDEAGSAGSPIREALVDDGVVASLLLIHDLYPVSLEERVAEALASVQPYMESHGGGVELLSLQDGVARLKLQGSCDGCSASSATLELAIKKALMETAPDLAGLEVEPPSAEVELSGTPLPIAPKPARLSPAAPAEAAATPSALPAAMPPVSGWLEVDGLGNLGVGEHAAVPAGGTVLLVANVNDTLLAYLNSCAGCDSPLEGGALEEGVLACPSCSVRFDLPRAGRSVDDTQLQLAPVPLLRDGPTRVRVALTA